MKKLFTIFSFAGLLAINNADAQHCGGVSTAPLNTSVGYGFTPAAADLPCAVRGVYYEENIYIKIPHDITEPEEVTVNSARIDSIRNLPCGLCWKVDRESRTYNHDEYGVITVYGTTNDPVGQYNLEIIMDALLEGDPTWQENYDASLANFYMSIRVANDGSSCAPYQSNPGKNATCATSAINDLADNINTVAITPNPMNNNAILSFTSEKAGSYTVSVMDVLGKTVSSKSVKAVIGNNETVVERNNIPQGVYFVNISDGLSRAVKKFVVAD